MRKHKGAWLGLAIILATLAFSANAFKTNLVNYVPFDEALAAPGASVQIMGAPTGGRATYTDGHLHFAMTDGKVVVPVVYKGPKPEDLDSAMDKSSKITAQGTYDAGRKVFVAQTLLVKCPSKYQGGENDRSYGTS